MAYREKNYLLAAGTIDVLASNDKQYHVHSSSFYAKEHEKQYLFYWDSEKMTNEK